jgi:hypothetical protein
MGAGVLDARGHVKAVQRYESDSAAITHLAFYACIPAAISASEDCNNNLRVRALEHPCDCRQQHRPR